MSVNSEKEAVEVEKTRQNPERIDLSRRTFLSCLAVLGVGGAAAMTLGVTKAEAASETGGANTPAEGEKAESPKSPIRTTRWSFLLKYVAEFAGRRVRRGARRVRRRTGVGRRVYRWRGRRAVCRVRRRV